MLTIFADALLLAAGQNPLPRPVGGRPRDAEGDRAWLRFWLNYAAMNR